MTNLEKIKAIQEAGWRYSSRCTHYKFPEKGICSSVHYNIAYDISFEKGRIKK